MRTVPYTTSTGVKIGSRWNESPKPMPIDDPDMILIQGWLIQSPEWHRSRRLERIIYGLSTAFALLVAIAMMVSK